MTHPYASLPARAFWRSGVAGRSARGVEDVWRPKFEINPATPIATFGSCFAQHIGAALRARAFNWLQTEPPPRALSPENAKAHGYDLFTCRTGNIYSAKNDADLASLKTSSNEAMDLLVSEALRVNGFRKSAEAKN